MRSRVIVGLMDGDQQPSEARLIGAAVAKAGAILLTGGAVGDKDSRRIHQAAMHEASTISDARLIGILPSSGREPRFQYLPSAKGFYFHTGMTSEERDFITGITPDILIFLRGSAGTLLELAYAAAAGRPTYFLDSVGYLRDKLRAEASKQKIHWAFNAGLNKCATVGGQALSVGKLEQLASGRLTSAVDFQGPVATRVSEFIESAQGNLGKETGFPKLQGADHKPEFERRVLELECTC